MQQRKLCLGLTGGIGSGKSTAAHFLAELGASIVDADKISHQLTAPGGEAIEVIREQFGSAFVTTDGALDRDRMRRLVFQDHTAKQALEGILHPLIRDAMHSQKQLAWQEGRQLVVMDIPLLSKMPYWRSQLDAVCVIDCSETTQIQRVVKRNSFTAEQVQKIIQAQASRSERLSCADITLHNESPDLSHLKAQVASLWVHMGL